MGVMHILPSMKSSRVCRVPRVLGATLPRSLAGRNCVVITAPFAHPPLSSFSFHPIFVMF